MINKKGMQIMSDNVNGGLTTEKIEEGVDMHEIREHSMWLVYGIGGLLVLSALFCFAFKMNHQGTVCVGAVVPLVILVGIRRTKIGLLLLTTLYLAVSLAIISAIWAVLYPESLHQILLSVGCNTCISSISGWPMFIRGFIAFPLFILCFFSVTSCLFFGGELILKFRGNDLA